MTYSDLQESLRVMRLGERATIKEIKARHRELVKLHHPDTGSTDNPEMIRQVNLAYKNLLEYITEYRFSFAENEFYEQNPEARIFMQFADDLLWGKK